MKNLQSPAALIDSQKFLKLIDNTCRNCNEDITTQQFIASLRKHIFAELGQVNVEMYLYRDSEYIYVPQEGSNFFVEDTSPAVPLSIPGQGSLLENLRQHRVYQSLTPESDVPSSIAATGNTSHAFFPIFTDENLVAIIYIGSKELLAFPEDFLLGMETLTTVIGSRLKSLEIISRLKKITTVSEKSEQLQQALYDISEQAHLATSEEELYRSLHRIVARLINARNFFIALRQERNGRQFIKFVYYCDEFDSYLQGMEFELDSKKKPSMSAYLLQSGKPILLGPDRFDEFCRQEGVEPLGTKAHSLVGVPFYLEHLAGVVLVQSYREEIYSDKDKDLLVYVARHIGDALSRKKAIDDMREANEIFSLFMAYSPIHVYIKEVRATESRILQISDAYAQSLEKSSTQLIGKTMTELFPADFAARTLADDWQVVSSGIPLQREEYLGGKTYATVKFPISQGGKSLLAGYSIDISERKKHEQEQQKIEKLEALGILAGGIAHDFNNILTAILGNISFLQVLLDGDHSARKRLGEAEKAAKRAAELAQQLLTFARGGEPNKKVIALRPLVHDAVSLMLRGSNVRAAVTIPDDLQTISADEGQISQALNNLILNAAQAMPGGGVLTISAKNQELNEDNNLGLAVGKYVKLQLSDEGCGISPDNLAKIFDPYFSTKSAGTGLGLATTYSIIARHNGHIHVQSTVGKGTTFTLYLPSLGELSETVTPVAGKSTTSHPGGAVLVMDDEKMIRDIAAAMLSHLGYAVTTCASGEEAIELYRASMHSGSPFAAVIMDLTIPGGLGGKQAAEQLLTLAPAAHLIVSSGYSNDPIMASYREYGFSGAIAKPYSIADFEQVLGGIPSTF